MNENLREYTEVPDMGLYPKIEKRVQTRRMWRWSGIVAAGIVIIGGSLWYAIDKAGSTPAPTYAQLTEPLVPATTAEYQQDMQQDELQDVPLPHTQSTPSMPSIQSEELPTPLLDESFQADILDQQPQLASANIQDAHYDIDDLIIDYTPTNLPIETPQTDTTNTSSILVHSTKDNSAPLYENVFTAPNIILPESDDDALKVFKLHASEQVEMFHLAIFNRGGRQVFSSHDIQQAWNATINGARAPQGTYVWIATFRDNNGNPHREQGSVTIVR